MKADTKNTLPVKDKLLQAGLKLFSEYGYDATSTRMIAKEAEVVRSSIAFYFETKETLYAAVIENAIDAVNEFLDPLYAEITDAYEKGTIHKENASCYIFRLLKLQIHWYFDDEHSDIVRLIMREHSFQTETRSFFYDVLYNKVVSLLAKLIITATGMNDQQQALLLALSINGSVQAMGEHRSFTRKAFEFDQQPMKKAEFLEKLINTTLDNTKSILMQTGGRQG